MALSKKNVKNLESSECVDWMEHLSILEIVFMSVYVLQHTTCFFVKISVFYH